MDSVPEIFDTPPDRRFCANCVRFELSSSTTGFCEQHKQFTDTSDSCEKWDGE